MEFIFNKKKLLKIEVCEIHKQCTDALFKGE